MNHNSLRRYLEEIEKFDCFQPIKFKLDVMHDIRDPDTIITISWYHRDKICYKKCEFDNREIENFDFHGKLLREIENTFAPYFKAMDFNDDMKNLLD